MRSLRPSHALALLLGAALILPALSAASGARPAAGDHRIVVVKDGGEEMTLRFEGDGHRLVFLDENGEQTGVIDLSGIGDLVSDALAEAGAALEDLPDIRVDLEEDGVVRLREDGREIRIDVERIMEDVSASLEKAFEGFDHRERVRLAPRHLHERRAAAPEAEIDRLRREVARLEREMAALREEMARLRQRQQH